MRFSSAVPFSSLDAVINLKLSLSILSSSSGYECVIILPPLAAPGEAVPTGELSQLDSALSALMDSDIS